MLMFPVVVEIIFVPVEAVPPQPSTIPQRLMFAVVLLSVMPLSEIEPVVVFMIDDLTVSIPVLCEVV